MCSIDVYLANSCYIDDFAKVGEVWGTSIVLGIVIGTVVGVLVLSVRKFNS